MKGFRKISVGATLLIVVLLAILSISSLAQQKSSAMKSSPGAANFKTKCAMCHGVDGMGNTPMGKQLQAFDLQSAQVQNHNDDELKQIIAKGEGNMPAFEEQVSPEQISELVDYIRLWRKKGK